METQKNQVVEHLNKATNILVAVSTNPSVDQLAGAIGLTLLLNKLNKHATAVFSGGVPSTLEFLQPDKTLEKNTDSLRDFIIALDKSKADKLRYKVEDQMVKIFITPYMTSISDKDLEFSQGDFNVEVVLAVGVNEQQDLDQAITGNGRILHDATVMSINTHTGGSLGSINWVDESASSLCEMLVSLGLTLKPDVLDSQMATALLTGIVAETNRFSNEKTSSETMQMSAKLMTAGANQQLVASQLQPPAPEPPTETPVAEDSEAENIQLPEIEEEGTEDLQPGEPELPVLTPVPAPEAADGTLEISHSDAPEEPKIPPGTIPEATGELPPESAVEQIHIDENGMLKPLDDIADVPLPSPVADVPESDNTSSRLIMNPPSRGGTLTANTTPDDELEPSTDILGATNNQSPILNHADDTATTNEDAETSIPLPEISVEEPTSDASITPASIDSSPQTLSQLEELVTGAHVAAPDSTPSSQYEPPQATLGTDLNAARDAVTQAVTSSPQQALPPVQALNAQPMDLNLGDMPAVSTSLASAFASNSSAPSLDDVPTINPTTSPPLVPLDPQASSDDSSGSTTALSSSRGVVMDPNAPPPVPPPMMPPPDQSMTYGQQPLPNAEDDNKAEDPMSAI